MSVTVNGFGHTPNRVMLVGEKPGRVEAARCRPFVGPAGKLQQQLIKPSGLTPHLWYLTNIDKQYAPGNPDPTPDDISRWASSLEGEIAKCQPELIITVGRFATRWFLGDDVDLDMVRGIPQRWGELPESQPIDITVLPVTHPAAGLHDPDRLPAIFADYQAIAPILHKVKHGESIDYRIDKYAGKENYLDISGADLADTLYRFDGHRFALDTEGNPSNPWSIQVCLTPGEAFVLRCTDRSFHKGVKALQKLVDGRVKVITHDASTQSGCLFDTIMCRAMGLDISRANVANTMYMLYLLLTEPQGLKPAMYRWCGMSSRSYDDVVGPIAISKQLQFLSQVTKGNNWSKPEPRVVTANDGTSKLYTPRALAASAIAIIRDIEADKRDKDGELVDIAKRWGNIPLDVREPAGVLPTAALDDADRDEAIHYAACDADGTLRLHDALLPVLQREGLTQLHDDGCKVMAIAEQMQRNGMPVSRRKLVKLERTIQSQMSALVSSMSVKYNGGKPYNPKSGPQTATIMQRRGLKSAKRTPTGQPSTSKKAIQHLTATDEFIRYRTEWCDLQHHRDNFATPIIARLPADIDLSPICGVIKPTRVTTRRFAMERPNLMNQPIRHELGKMIRDCYVAPHGQVFGGFDYSQVEMRVAAHISKDPLLCRLFREGRDIHAETAAHIFGIPVADVDSFKHRLPTKTIGFGTIYGQQEYGLMDSLRTMGLPVKDGRSVRCQGEDVWALDRCREFRLEYLTLYSGIKQSIADTAKQIRRTGKVVDMWGMPRLLPGAWLDDPRTRAECERQGFNHLVQGGAQGMLQRAMIHLGPIINDLVDGGLNIKWCLQFHDELILLMDEELFDLVDDVMCDAMVNHCGVKLIVPVEVDSHKATTWGELK